MNILEVKNLVKVYGGSGQMETRALDGLNLNIEDGEMVAIMGPSGSGKTTLLNLISGIDKPTSGKIKISEKLLNDMDQEELAVYRRRYIGFVFQEFNHY